MNNSISESKPKKKMIPIFLDHSGTADQLLPDDNSLENLKNYILQIQEFAAKLSKEDPESEYEFQTYIITGCKRPDTKAFVGALHTLAKNGIEVEEDGEKKKISNSRLFAGGVAECCGCKILTNPDVEECSSINPNAFIEEDIIEMPSCVKEIKDKIQDIIKEHQISDDEPNKIDEDYKSILAINFPQGIEKSSFDAALEEIKAITPNGIIINDYFDEFGNDIHLMSSENNKASAVEKMMEYLRNQGYDIPFVIIGGDDQRTDLPMYTKNKGKLGVPTFFIAPSKIGELAPEYKNDPNIIVGSLKNIRGIIENLGKLTERLHLVKGEGDKDTWELEQ